MLDLSPQARTPLSMRIQVSDGNKFTMGVKVVRSYSVPQRLTRFVPSGFCVRFQQAPEEYFQLLARLFASRRNGVIAELGSTLNR